jgi:hypothetical protein
LRRRRSEPIPLREYAESEEPQPEETDKDNDEITEVELIDITHSSDH